MKKVYLHPLPLRIWHWANATVVVLLITTGTQLRIPGIAAVRANSLNLQVHRYAGWAMTTSCLFWFLYSIASDTLRRHYVTGRLDPGGIFRQARFYLFSMFRGEENPFRPSSDEKFNPLQKLAYGIIMCIVTPLLVVTGILLSDILLFRKYMLLLNAVRTLDAIHVICAYVVVLYLVVHLYLATFGRTASSHIKAMIVGYEEEPDEPGADARQAADLSIPHPSFPPDEAAICQERNKV